MKLEDIKKENIHSVPDRYFDRLPARIQSRVNEKKYMFGFRLDWRLALRVASPVLAVVLVIFYFNYNNSPAGNSTDDLLAQVSTEDLIAYLETTDITTDEIIDELDFSTIDLDFYEEGPIMQNMDMSDEEIDALFDEYGLDGDLL